MATLKARQVFQTLVTALLIRATVLIVRCFKAIFVVLGRPRLVHSMFVSAVAVSLRAFQITSVVILICAVSTSWLGAQTPHNIQDDTKAALASEWKDPNAVGQVLKAFQLLTSSSQAPDLNQKILDQLTADGYSSKLGLYRAAIGNTDVPGLNMVDIVAKANTLKKKKPDDEDNLFASTQKLIDEIFSDSKITLIPNPLVTSKKHKQEPLEIEGPVALARINQSFVRQDKNAALYQLLDSYPKPSKDANLAAKKEYAEHLETLRAAFEMNVDMLASQVAATITAKKE